MPIQIPTVQTGLEASIEAAAKRAGRSLKINMGPGARSIEGLSQPLGRITGKADQFTKSMEAANARVLAFGASVGVLSAVTRGFKELVNTTIEVQKQMTAINSILGQTTAQLDKFKKEIFDVARNTEQSFATVADAALELSRQGLKAEEVTKRLNDSLVLSRLSGLGAAEAVAGLTSAINSFNSTGVTSAEVLNKLSAAAVSAAVSERDLIEGIKRSGAVAIQAGVSLDELVGVITAVQERTARGGAVIGNSFKTIFTRIQSLDKLKTMQSLGVEVTDTAGQVLSATQLIQNLAKTLETLPDAKRLQIAEGLVGKFQIAPFLAILEDYNRETSTAIKVTEIASNATNEAYSRNVALNKTLSAAINEATINLKELADTLGKIGVTDSLKNILGFFNSLVGKIQDTLEGEGLGSQFAKGIVKGIGGILSGPGLAIFAAIIGKLAIDLAKFGVGSLKTFFGLNKAAQQQATLQGQIASTLLGNKGIQEQIMKIENSTLSVEQKRAAQIQFFTTALNQQLKIMTQMQSIAARVTPGVIAGTRGRAGRAAGGYIPNYNAVIGYGSEQADISRGVGGAPKSARPVTIPNFNFGGGQRGTVVANNSEYMVPNFAGGDGSAIFNQDMVNSMGLPANARRIGAAGGYIPNFAKRKINAKDFFYLVPRLKGGLQSQPLGDRTIGGQKVGGAIAYGLRRDKLQTASDNDETLLQKNITNSLVRHTSRWVNRLQPLGRSVKPDEVRRGFKNTRGAKGAMMGAIGAAFEVGITSALDYKAAAREKGGDFDVRGGIGLSKVRELFGFPATQNTGDFKVGTGSDSVISFYKKVIKERGQGKFGVKEQEKNVALLAKQELKRDRPDLFQKGSLTPIHATRGETDRLLQQRQAAIAPRFRGLARGYIPNYASSPLQDAISREAAAGLPINQIRINQDSSLKNAGNPMGLAVTNMRDEPTGAIPAARGFIPNFNRSRGGFSGFDARTRAAQAEKKLADSANRASTNVDKLGKSGEKGAEGQRDLLGGVFAVQMGMSALSGATSGLESRVGQVANAMAKMGSSVTTAAFAGVAINDFGKSIGGAGGKLVSKLGLYGAAVGAGIAVFKGIASAIDAATGFTDKNNLAMAKLAESASKAARNLNDVGAVEKEELTQMARKRVGALRDDVQGRGSVMRGFGPFEPRILRTQEDRDQYIKDRRQAMREKGINNPAAMKNPLIDAEVIGPNLDSIGLSMRKETAEKLELLLAQSVVTGISADTIEDLARKFAEKQGKPSPIPRTGGLMRQNLDMDEMNMLIDVVTKMREATMGFDKLIENLPPEQKEAIFKAGKVSLEGGANNDPNIFGNENMEAVREKLKAINIDDADQMEKFYIMAFKSINAQRVLQAQKSAEEEKRIATSLAKLQIDIAIDRAKGDKTLLNQMDERILKAELSKSLTEDETIALETQKQVLEANIGLRDKTLDAVGAMAKASEEITFKEGEALELRKLIADSAKKTSFTDQERKDLINQTLKLLEESDDRIKEKLLKEIEGLKTEEKKTKELTKQVDLLGRAKIAASQLNQERALSDLRVGQFAEGQTFERVEGRKEAIRRRSQNRIARETGAFTTEGSEALQRRALQDAVLDAKDEARNARDELIQTQESQILKRIGGLGSADLGRIMNNAGLFQDASASDLAAMMGSRGALDAAIADVKDDKVRQELIGFRQELDNSIDSLDAQSKATLANAEANLKAAGYFALTPQQILENIGTDLERGAGQGAVDLALATDAKTRARLAIREQSRSREAAAAKAGDFDLVRSIREADQLKTTLSDASHDFAQNIGDAMVMAIARGEDLGDSLRSAASDFFLMLSKAFMQQAVNNIAGSAGGQGFIGGFVNLITGKNAGGMITGGSGVRDDVPTLLTGGEFVMRKGAVQKYGTDFMSALNAGRIGGMQRGGYFTPGTFGQGAIEGKDALFDYFTQSFTTGQKDRIMTGPGVGSVALEPHSVRMTRWAMKNSRLAQQERDSQQGAFGLWSQQLDKEKAEEEARKQQKRALRNSIISMVAMAALSGATGGFGKKGGAGSVGFGDAGTSTPPLSGGGAQPWYKKLFSGVGNFFRGGGSGQTAAPRYGYGASNPTSTGLGGGTGVLPPLPDWNNPAVMGGRRSFAAGGSVPYAAGIDTVPTMLSGGEFVMNAAATQNIGRGNLAAMNSGVGGRGGDRDVVNRLDELIAVSENQSGESVINITVNSDGTTVQNNENMNDDQQSLAMKIRDQVRQVIEEEKRLGGSLRPIRTARA